MNRDPVPGKGMFKAATIMSALWLGTNAMLVWQAYGVETGPKPKVETSSTFAEVHADAHLDNLPIQARL
jgi:hypothetical protein